MNNIDFDSILKIVSERSDLTFHFIGPYKLDSANNNLGFQKDNSNEIGELLSMGNTIFYGLKSKDEVIKIISRFDAMMVAYYQYGYHKFAPVNSHKILEFLAMGKLVISNYFDDYLDVKDKYIHFPSKGHSPNEYVKKFNQVMAKIDSYNSVELQRERIKYGTKKTYWSNSVKMLDKIQF